LNSLLCNFLESPITSSHLGNTTSADLTAAKIHDRPGYGAEAASYPADTQSSFSGAKTSRVFSSPLKKTMKFSSKSYPEISRL
jgi:hypothetical protein